MARGIVLIDTSLPRGPMTTAVKAIHEDGVFKPKEPVELEEHAEVEVLIPTHPKRDPDSPTGWKTTA
jgi:hypothetical protein